MNCACKEILDGLGRGIRSWPAAERGICMYSHFGVRAKHENSWSCYVELLVHTTVPDLTVSYAANTADADGTREIQHTVLVFSIASVRVLALASRDR